MSPPTDAVRTPWTPDDSSRRPRVVVAGTKFGRIHLAAVESDPDVELAGVLARGSERSRACAAAYGVPLHTTPDEIPADVDIVCVVVGTAITGGPGAELAQDLLARGFHVLQEHPVHHDELAACLRAARRGGAVYRLTTHYTHLEPVRRFLDAASTLGEHARPLFVDAMAGVQVGFSLIDVVARAVGALRPFRLEHVGEPVPGRPFRTVEAVVGGVPLSLRLQHQLDPADPDNHAHLLHRITLGSEAGVLTLVGSHGPVTWSPRPHLPAEAAHHPRMHETPSTLLDLPSAEPLGDAAGPCDRDVVGSVWPAGVRRALAELRAAAGGDAAVRAGEGQYHLGVCRAWQELTAALGPVELVSGHAPATVPAGVLTGDRIEQEES